MTTLATYWSMTINNPTESDMVLIMNPNDRCVKQLVWSPEEGEDGTPHIQAWLRLQRNNSMAFVKKLYPRGHFRPCLKDEYNENTHRYAQKNDETTRGQHTITLNEPVPAVDTLLYRVMQLYYESQNWTWRDPAHVSQNEILKDTQLIENQLVSREARLEKLFISTAYEKMKKRFFIQILMRIDHQAKNPPEIILPVLSTDDAASEADSNDGRTNQPALRPEASGQEDGSEVGDETESESGEGSDFCGSEGSDEQDD